MTIDTLTGILGNLAGLFLSLWFASLFWPGRRSRRTGAAGLEVHISADSSVSVSSRASNSAPSSSAATVQAKSASETVKSQAVRISRKEYREALSRMQRKA